MQKSTIYRKPMGENLFEEEFTIDALSQMGNPLERLAALVDFEMFRPALEEVLVKKDCKTPAGRPQIDVVLMFKVIFLQRYYGLGDHQIQYQIIDRTSFRQFLCIHTESGGTASTRIYELIEPIYIIIIYIHSTYPPKNQRP